ncbi:MAG TPA: hypothetical protein VGT40_13865 [Methylomirabilota bacterium]|nr:hypothetical protein [Methylomirabilota bacterium]
MKGARGRSGRRYVGLAALALALAWPSAGHSNTIVDLGTLGGDSSEASGINNLGQVVGWSITATGATHAFVYRGGAMTDLGTLTGGTRSYATGINDAGQVVGYGGINAFGPQFKEITQGFIWDNGSMQPLGALYCPCTFNTRYGTSSAYGINALRQVVGASETVRGSHVLHGFLWDASAGMQDIGGGAGDWSISRAFAINGAGQVVGDFAQDAGMSATPFDRRAFLWQNGVRNDLGTLSGHTSSQALAINGAGQAVGWSGGRDGASSRAVLWDGGGIHDLGTLPGDESAQARAINAGGQVVGQSVAPGGSASRAFLWEGGVMRDLNSLLPAGSGWVLTSASAINDAGHIAGVGLSNGKVRAFLLLNDTPSLAAAILPTSRSVQVGTAATAFATIINPGSSPADGCAPRSMSQVPASFTFQTTDPATNAVIGSPDTPANIPAGGRQTYVLAFTPAAPIVPTDITVGFSCDNRALAPVTVGVNTLLLVASLSPVPDIIAVGATLGNDGIVDIPGPSGTGVFAVATSNVGTAGLIVVTADTGEATLPVQLALCQTNPATGACLAAPSPTVTLSIAAGATPTFGVFVTGSGNVPFDPGAHRIFVRFTDDGAVTRGSTSVAVRTQ